MSGLTCLLYLSTSCGPLPAAEVEALLHSARRNNDEAGVTGALLHYDDRFLQVLEGEPAAVEACFSRICRDPRHHDVRPLFSAAQPQRRFAGWSMRYLTPAGADRAVADFLDRLQQAPQPEAVQQALALLQGLARSAAPGAPQAG